MFKSETVQRIDGNRLPTVAQTASFNVLSLICPSQAMNTMHLLLTPTLALLPMCSHPHPMRRRLPPYHTPLSTLHLSCSIQRYRRRIYIHHLTIGRRYRCSRCVALPIHHGMNLKEALTDRSPTRSLLCYMGVLGTPRSTVHGITPTKHGKVRAMQLTITHSHRSHNLLFLVASDVGGVIGAMIGLVHGVPLWNTLWVNTAGLWLWRFACIVQVCVPVSMAAIMHIGT